MRIILNTCKNFFYNGYVHINTFMTTNLLHGLVLQHILVSFVLDYYENFLLVILCKYNLGLIRFAIAKWLYCGLLFLCVMEFCYGWVHLTDNHTNLCLNFLNDGYLDVIDLFNSFFDSFFNNFWSLKEPALPKDLHVLTYNTVEPTKTVEIIGTVDDPEVVPIVKRPYCVYVGAFLVLYWGVCLVGSGA